jgi:hypothetical protein
MQQSALRELHITLQRGTRESGSLEAFLEKLQLGDAWTYEPVPNSNDAEEGTLTLDDGLVVQVLFLSWKLEGHGPRETICLSIPLPLSAPQVLWPCLSMIRAFRAQCGTLSAETLEGEEPGRQATASCDTRIVRRLPSRQHAQAWTNSHEAAATLAEDMQAVRQLLVCETPDRETLQVSINYDGEETRSAEAIVLAVCEDGRLGDAEVIVESCPSPHIDGLGNWAWMTLRRGTNACRVQVGCTTQRDLDCPPYDELPLIDDPEEWEQVRTYMREPHTSIDLHIPFATSKSLRKAIVCMTRALCTANQGQLSISDDPDTEECWTDEEGRVFSTVGFTSYLPAARYHKRLSLFLGAVLLAVVYVGLFVFRDAAPTWLWWTAWLVPAMACYAFGSSELEEDTLDDRWDAEAVEHGLSDMRKRMKKKAA